MAKQKTERAQSGDRLMSSGEQVTNGDVDDSDVNSATLPLRDPQRSKEEQQRLEKERRDREQRDKQEAQRNAAKKTAPRDTGKTKLCRVIMLDNRDYEVAVPTGALGQVLLDRVSEHANLVEKDYFACSYVDNVNGTDTRFWLANDKKISDQLKKKAWNFRFEVKFYPPDASSLQEDITKYLLCLQLRNDILAGKLPCSFVTHALLGSYTVQSELGDYDVEEHGSGFEYIKDFPFAPNQTEDLLDKIAELHRTHRGLTPCDAELEYLKNGTKLAMYGVDLHQAWVPVVVYETDLHQPKIPLETATDKRQTKKQDPKKVELMIGVCASGLLVYREKLRILRFTWAKILKIAYKRNIFYITIRPGPEDGHRTPKQKDTVGFEMANYRMAKRLWKTAVEHHAFFRLREPDPAKRHAFGPFGSRFRYSGRTQHQLRAEPTHRQAPTFDRTGSKRYPGSKSMNDMPTYSTERTEQQYLPDDRRINTLDLKNRKKPGAVPIAELDDDRPGEHGMYDNDGQLLMRPGGGVAYSKSGAPPTYQHPGAELYDKFGNTYTPGSGDQAYDNHGNPYDPHAVYWFDQDGNPYNRSNGGRAYDQYNKVFDANDPQMGVHLYDQYGSAYNPITGEMAYDKYGKPYVPGSVKLYDKYGNPYDPAVGGQAYDAYGNPYNARPLYHGQDPLYSTANKRPTSGTGSIPDGAQRDIHGNIIITKNVVITASLDPSKGGKPSGEEELPPYQDDLFAQHGIRAAPGTSGGWTSTSHTTKTSTRTYTAPDGTIITEHKTEKDGVVETRIEKRLVVTSDEEMDHDKALADAIRAVTDMNPDLSVEKIEIQTKTETEA